MTLTECLALTKLPGFATPIIFTQNQALHTPTDLGNSCDTEMALFYQKI